MDESNDTVLLPDNDDEERSKELTYLPPLLQKKGKRSSYVFLNYVKLVALSAKIQMSLMEYLRMMQICLFSHCQRMNC